MHIQALVYTHTHMYTHTHTHTRMHARMHAHTHAKGVFTDLPPLNNYMQPKSHLIMLGS